MRIFLFLCSALCLLLAAHRFSIAEPSGQYKGALFFLLIGIQLLITAALISEHRESQRPMSSRATDKSQTSTENEHSKEARLSGVNVSKEHEKKS